MKAARNGGLFSDALLFHGGIPIVCYAGIITAAWLGVNSTRQAYLALRAVSALLLFAGNAKRLGRCRRHHAEKFEMIAQRGRPDQTLRARSENQTSSTLFQTNF